MFTKIWNALSPKSPTAAEDARIFAAMTTVYETEKSMATAFSIPEINSIWHQCAGNPPKDDLQTWSFAAVFLENLKDKGWPTDRISYPGKTDTMNGLLSIISPGFQGTSPGAMGSYLRYYRKKGEAENAAVDFLYAHVDQLEKTAEELKGLKETDLTDKHRMVIGGTNRCAKPQQP
jgi:hypothetical protein